MEVVGFFSVGHFKNRFSNVTKSSFNKECMVHTLKCATVF